MFDCFIIGNLVADAKLVKGHVSEFVSFRLAADMWDYKKNTSVTVYCDVVCYNVALAGHLLKGRRVFVSGNVFIETYQNSKGEWLPAVKVFGRVSL